MSLLALGIICLWPFSGLAPPCPCLALKNGSFALKSSNVSLKADIFLLREYEHKTQGRTLNKGVW